jgi:hypothetical protein
MNMTSSIMLRSSVESTEAFFKSKVWTDLGPDRDKALKTIRRYAVEQRN